ncbi:MAG TPA: AraC family transcriptional regulator [Puia sp.]|nr:AraC family transcriptional regulator [Puia sp.]
MYIGRAIDTSTHDHHAIQIALSFDHPFFINSPEGSFKKVMAVIIDSDQPHECRTNDNTFLLLNIDPMTTIGRALKKNYLTRRAVMELPEEDTTRFLQSIEQCLAEDPLDSGRVNELTRQYVHRLSALNEPPVIDDRIQQVMKILEEKKDESFKIEDLAAEVFLSPGRLTHLFKKQVGIPIKKYVLWARILQALQKVFETKNLREAALYAGFSDASHFNRTFRKMFGLYPSAILKNSQNVQAFWK